jgi:putative transposase
MARSRSLFHGIVRRAKIILTASEGLNNKTIAQKIKLSAAVVGMWRKRFIQHGLMGLYDEQKPGGPRSIIDEQLARLIRKTLNKKPLGSTHWACRSVAEETQLSESTVHRVWKAFGIQPRRQKYFKLSTDPFFVEKVRDSVGLYTNPPDKAMVLASTKKAKFKL